MSFDPNNHYMQCDTLEEIREYCHIFGIFVGKFQYYFEERYSVPVIIWCSNSTANHIPLTDFRSNGALAFEYKHWIDNSYIFSEFKHSHPEYFI